MVESDGRGNGVPRDTWAEKGVEAMLELGGTFRGFMDALFGFVSELLSGIFGFLTSMFSGIDIMVS